MNTYLKLAIGAGIGSVLGYAYYYFIGCQSGTCPLTSNWHITTVYGAAVGLALAFPGKKKDNSNDNTDKNQN